MPTILGGLAIILAAAKLGGDLATRARQPAVLGELVAGVLLGNLGLIGITGLQGLESNATLETLAQIGVIILLFEVGLESTVGDMMKVGVTAVLVATLGVIAPFVLGWLVGALLLPAESWYAHAFLGATLTATSVGITARVLKDLGKSTTPEARVILGAAVVDDVFGLVILAVLSGIIAAANAGTPMDFGSVGLIVVKAGLFLGGALALGRLLSPRVFGLASRLHGRGGAGVLLRIELRGGADRARPDRRRLRGGADPRGRPLPALHRARGTHTRRAAAADRHVSRAAVLRADGHARRPHGVRPPGNSGTGCAPDGGRHPRQAGVRARGHGRQARPAHDRPRHDPPRRGGADFREYRIGTDDRRCGGDRPEHLLRGRAHGDRHDARDTARAALEP